MAKVNSITPHLIRKWHNHEVSQQKIFKQKNEIGVIYKRAAWVRAIDKFVFLPIACMPCCLFSCFTRVLTCTPGGNSLTLGSDGCMIKACEAADEPEPENYEWIETVIGTDYIKIVKNVLVDWIVITNEYATKNSAKVIEDFNCYNTLNKLIARLENIVMPMHPSASTLEAFNNYHKLFIKPCTSQDICISAKTIGQCITNEYKL